MDDVGPLRDQILTVFETLAPQVQAAARYVLNNPMDVALLSMREQAKRAGVPPATMMRLAQKLGFGGYDAIRSLYAQLMRRGGDAFSDRAGDLVERWKTGGETALGVDLLETIGRQVDDLRRPDRLAEVAAAAKLVSAGRRVLVAGQHSAYPVAYLFAYLAGIVGCDARMVDAPGGAGIDALHGAGAEDVLVVVTIRPYARASLAIADHARARGVQVVAITDSAMAPVAPGATARVIVGVESPSFFHSMVPTLAAIESLVALVAAERGETAMAAITERETLHESFGVMIASPARSRPRG
jgi:DNA-binding MurR/RpiR family transcriptional regulator